MEINTERKELSLNKCSIIKDISSWIEQDLIVPDSKPDAVKIVNVIVTPYVNTVEVMDGKIRVTGKLNYFVIYNVNDEKFNTRGLFMTYPYTEVLDVKDITNDMNVCIIPICKNVIYSLPNERKIAIKSEILFKIKAKKCVNISLLKSFNEDVEVECKMCKGEFNNIIQNKKNIICSKEDIMMPKEAEDFFEILNISSKIKNTEYKESYNKIMVKGDIEIKLLYLSQNDEDEIKKIYFTIPFSTMIELENIKDKSKFDINYVMQDFNMRVNEDITSTKTMTADYQIEVEVTMYEEEDNNYIEDFYSQARNLEYENNEVDIVKRNITLIKEIDIKESISNILPINTKIVDYTLDTTNIVSTINQSTVILEGNAKITLLLKNIDTNEIETKVIEVLINESFPIDEFIDKNKFLIDILDSKLIVTQDGTNIEAKINLTVGNSIEDTAKLNIINKIEEALLDTKKLDSINIYIVKQGDTLWNIAKKYKTSVSKIVTTNSLEDPNKIEVGQKILIIR